ncbi:hypothetical protein [Conexibacter woesei]|uniref:hypothetical protein n=1 Tax=Conexibacter woesei TaxID=191495 RepID=UPI000428DB3F|nr:hypothetical protein [Conexibacter woesei]
MTATLSLFRPSILDPAPEPEIRAARLAPTLGDRLVAERQRAEASAAVVAPEARSFRTPVPAAAPEARVVTAPAAVPATPVETPPAAPVVGATLDDLLVGVWEDLATHRTVACPACGDEMIPRYSAGPAPVGGRCTSCTATLS